MRILLLDSHDSPRLGPWSNQRWDLVVDLGRASACSAESWAAQYGCPVLRSDSFRAGLSDLRAVRQLLSAGSGRLVDEEGIDWWDLTSLLFVSEVLELLVLRRVAQELDRSAEIWISRAGASARLMTALLGRQINIFGESILQRCSTRVAHYLGIARSFSSRQIKEILLDKYDPGYRWRSHLAPRAKPFPEPVVLLPSAYVNVSRMAVAYARLLPERRFLMVATRQNAKQFMPAANVEVSDLSQYASGDPPTAEIASLLNRWNALQADLCSLPDIGVLARMGALGSLAAWMRDGLCVRNAWRVVLEREPVCAVLCGDDSNRYTRLPVLLAAKQKIPTVDFHHGALDGDYLLKQLPCDCYLAKSEMEHDYLVRLCGLPAEKIAIAPAPLRYAPARQEHSRTSAVFFSEPYEVLGARADEVYREVLPGLCRVARENGRNVIVKLHPFESASQRDRLLGELLAPADRKLVSVIEGPLTAELMGKSWFGITIESSTAVDCREEGVPCFLCGWITLLEYGYAEQFARFGVAERLLSPEEIGSIPRRIEAMHNQSAQGVPHGAIDPAMLERWMGLRQEHAEERAIS